MRAFVLYLTYLRIALSPLVFILIAFLDYLYLGLFVFVIASMSDFFDGFLARKFSVESELGEVLDPIADKILTLFALLAIITYTNDIYITFICALIISREFWVSGLRIASNSNQNTQTLKVSYLGKLKTAFQFFSVFTYFFGFAINNSLITFLATFLLFLSMLLGLKSGLDYSKKFFS